MSTKLVNGRCPRCGNFKPMGVDECECDMETTTTTHTEIRRSFPPPTPVLVWLGSWMDKPAEKGAAED